MEESPNDTLTADAITSDMLENLSIHDTQESEMLRLLNAELNDLLDLHNKQEFQTIEIRRKRVSCFIEKLVRDSTYIFLSFSISSLITPFLIKGIRAWGHSEKTREHS